MQVLSQSDATLVPQSPKSSLTKTISNKMDTKQHNQVINVSGCFDQLDLDYEVNQSINFLESQLIKETLDQTQLTDQRDIIVSTAQSVFQSPHQYNSYSNLTILKNNLVVQFLAQTTLVSFPEIEKDENIQDLIVEKGLVSFFRDYFDNEQLLAQSIIAAIRNKQHVFFYMVQTCQTDKSKREYCLPLIEDWLPLVKNNTTAYLLMGIECLLHYDFEFTSKLLQDSWRDSNGNSLLFHAISKNQPLSIKKYFQEQGVNKAQQTPLIFSVIQQKYGFAIIFKFLAGKVDVNMHTALSYAFLHNLDADNRFSKDLIRSIAGKEIQLITIANFKLIKYFSTTTLYYEIFKNNVYKLTQPFLRFYQHINLDKAPTSFEILIKFLIADEQYLPRTGFFSQIQSLKFDIIDTQRPEFDTLIHTLKSRRELDIINLLYLVQHEVNLTVFKHNNFNFDISGVRKTSLFQKIKTIILDQLSQNFAIMQFNLAPSDFIKSLFNDIDTKLDINYRGPNGETPLIQSIIDGNLKGINYYWFQSNIVDNNSNTVLMYLVMFNQTAWVDRCLYQIGMQNHNGQTALLLAIQHGFQNIDFLLDESDILDYDGNSTLIYAVKYNHTFAFDKYQIQKLFGHTNKLGVSALFMALKNQRMNMISLLAKKELNLRDYLGNTATMIAAQFGLLKCLPNYEVNILMTNHKNQTALLLAILGHQYEDALQLTQEAGRYVEGNQTCLNYLYEQSLKNNNLSENKYFGQLLKYLIMKELNLVSDDTYENYQQLIRSRDYLLCFDKQIVEILALTQPILESQYHRNRNQTNLSLFFNQLNLKCQDYVEKHGLFEVVKMLKIEINLTFFNLKINFVADQKIYDLILDEFLILKQNNKFNECIQNYQTYMTANNIGAASLHLDKQVLLINSYSQKDLED